jgi:hypothetical protein
LREIAEDMYPSLPGTPREYSQRAISEELNKILELESGDHNVDEVITIWEPTRPGYIRCCTFAKWDGECWVKHIPTNIGKSKTLMEIFSELEKKDEFNRRNENFKKNTGGVL